jgi:hypothetical protein
MGNVYAVVRGLLQSGYMIGLLSPHLVFITKAKAAAVPLYATIDRVPSKKFKNIRIANNFKKS